MQQISQQLVANLLSDNSISHIDRNKYSIIHTQIYVFLKNFMECLDSLVVIAHAT